MQGFIKKVFIADSIAPLVDEGLLQLKSLINLRELWLWRTKVTDEGLARFREGLPGVVIDGPPHE